MKHARALLSLLLLPATVLLRGSENENAPGFTLSGSDIQISIKATRQPVFPHVLKTEGYSQGKVTALMEISPEGKLLDWLIYYADHKRFAQAVEAVIEDWEIAPPSWNGKPISAIARVDVNFQSSGDIVSMDMIGTFQQMTGINDRHSPYAIGVAEISELDAPLKPVHVVPLNVAQSLLDQHGSGACYFRFFIDAEGKARLPHVVEVDGVVDDRLVAAAQAALSQWRFTPPTVKGKPAMVEARQPFHFQKKP